MKRLTLAFLLFVIQFEKSIGGGVRKSIIPRYENFNSSRYSGTDILTNDEIPIMLVALPSDASGSVSYGCDEASVGNFRRQETIAEESEATSRSRSQRKSSSGSEGRSAGNASEGQVVRKPTQHESVNSHGFRRHENRTSSQNVARTTLASDTMGSPACGSSGTSVRHPRREIITEASEVYSNARRQEKCQSSSEGRGNGNANKGKGKDSSSEGKTEERIDVSKVTGSRERKEEKSADAVSKGKGEGKRDQNDKVTSVGYSSQGISVGRPAANGKILGNGSGKISSVAGPIGRRDVTASKGKCEEKNYDGAVASVGRPSHLSITIDRSAMSDGPLDDTIDRSVVNDGPLDDIGVKTFYCWEREHPTIISKYLCSKRLDNERGCRWCGINYSPSAIICLTVINAALALTLLILFLKEYYYLKNAKKE